MDWHNFINMDGYGLYVWGSYGVTFIIILWMIVTSLWCNNDDA